MLKADKNGCEWTVVRKEDNIKADSFGWTPFYHQKIARPVMLPMPMSYWKMASWRVTDLSRSGIQPFWWTSEVILFNEKQRYFWDVINWFKLNVLFHEKKERNKLLQSLLFFLNYLFLRHSLAMFQAGVQHFVKM